MWTLQKLQNYIDEKVEENIHLDYKAADALLKTEGKKKEISKDVSAFANSDGGTIIYGVKEFQQGAKFLPEQIDPVKRNDFSKETLEQIINSNISPKVTGIIITPITIGGELDNTVVYIVEIPKSDTAHQANDKRYYKRYNFQSEAMDDWEVKDIINRKNKSHILLYLEPDLDKSFYERFINHPNVQIKYDVWLHNIGNKAAEYIDVYLSGSAADAVYFKEPKPSIYETTFEIPFTNEISHKVTIQDDEFVVNIQRIPLLPRISKLIGSLTINSDFIINGKTINVIISTEDNRVKITKSIPELVH